MKTFDKPYKTEDNLLLSEALEEVMLEQYFLLVRRIPGISLSPREYWETDTYTTTKLLELEHEVIKKEEKEYRKAKGESYSEPRDTSSQEMMDLADEMQEEA